MCLTELEKFEPAKKGWQVKRRVETNDGSKGYAAIFHSSAVLRLGEKYTATTMLVKCEPYGFMQWPDDRQSYWTGYHIFHNLADAEKYLQSRGGPPDSHCIVEVETEGPYTTGWQEFEFLDSRWGRISMIKRRARITVARSITLKMEISYGIADQDAVI